MSIIKKLNNSLNIFSYINSKIFRKNLLLGLDLLNILTLIFIFVSAITIYFFSEGDIRGINADFSLYIKPIENLKESNCILTECSKYFLPNNINNQWIPSPFYSIFFLLPITIFNSDLLFLLQGIILSICIFYLLKNILEEFYKTRMNKIFVSSILLIGFLNFNFIKDSLTSGTMSICFLFILLGIKIRKSFLYSLIMFCLAALTRSNYLFMSLSFMISICLFKPKNFKKYFYLSTLSSLFYILSYKFFYFSYPGSPYLGVFKSQSPTITNFFMERLPSGINLFNWDISFFELINYLSKDLSLLYGTLINYLFKIMDFLGFMHLSFFNDWRGIWIQKFVTLINFVIVYAPAFYLSCLLAILIWFFKVSLKSKFEEIYIHFGLIYIFIHSLYLGSSRYLIGIHFIFVAVLVKSLIFIIKNLDQTRKT